MIKLSLLRKIRAKYRHGDTVKIAEFSQSNEFKGKSVTRIPISHAINGKKASKNTIECICKYYGIEF